MFHNYNHSTEKITENIIKPETFSDILERNSIVTEIKKILSSFDDQCTNIAYKKGIYIYGSPGSGKTHFVVEVLKSLGYDVIKYDAGDVRNKALVDTITSNNVSNRNVLDMMSGRTKKIAIVMDEIDGMNNGDKGGINALIKLIRQKKTKKQKLENLTMNPIICIGNYDVDKKIKELIKVCHAFELKAPTRTQMDKLLDTIIYPDKLDKLNSFAPNQLIKYRPQILDYIQGDMRKMMFISNLCKTKPHLLTENTLQNIFLIKTFNEDSKKITASLINNPASFKNHNIIMNDTDRTIVALLWHENIADVIDKHPNAKKFPFYSTVLDNICYADYIDRITFQHQIWLFNEMSSLMKTFYNNNLYHNTFPENRGKFRPTEVRFTKVLTKYSTEYNNSLFIYNMCQELNMDKKDVIAFFQELRLQYGGGEFMQNPINVNQIENMFENYNISKLDIKRMYRYLDKNVKKDTGIIMDEDDDDVEI